MVGFPERLELRQRPGLILVHETRLADNISSQDRRKTPMNALLGHVSLPDARWERNSMQWQ